MTYLLLTITSFSFECSNFFVASQMSCLIASYLLCVFFTKLVVFLASNSLFIQIVCKCCMLHGSETWPVKKENELAFQWTEMMIRWMCGVKVTDRLFCNNLRE